MKEEFEFETVMIETVSGDDVREFSTEDLSLKKKGAYFERGEGKVLIPWENIGRLVFSNPKEDEEGEEESNPQEETSAEEETEAEESEGGVSVEDLLSQSVSDLEDTLDDVEDAEVVRTAMEEDGRKTAQSKYEDRLMELEG